MSENPPILLIDTNVWLDVYLPHRARQSQALELLRVAHNHDASLVFASQAALVVYQRVMVDNKRFLRQHAPLTEAAAIAIKRLAWDCVNEMREIAVPIPVDGSDLYLAAKFRDLHDDLEDDLVMAACDRAKANYLVTNDRKLLTHAPIDARTPTQMVELLQRGFAKGTAGAEATDDNRWLLRWLAE